MPVAPSLDTTTLGLPFMDQAHDYFMDLLAQVLEADDDRVEPTWRALVDCAAADFAEEDRWMEATGFSSRKVHRMQHLVVLQVMREGLLQAHEGRWLQVREMAHQLRAWFARHAQSLDAALAHHLRSVQFDPADSSRREPAMV